MQVDSNSLVFPSPQRSERELRTQIIFVYTIETKHRRDSSLRLVFYSAMAQSGLGVPVKLLHESLGHVITVELKTGQLYRGKLAEGAL